MWLDRPSQWDALVPRLLAAREVGIDTETYGQPDRTSPQHRARVHCLSLAILGTTRSPRGYRRAHGLVLPRAALDHDSLVNALRAITLWAHNAPHDEHSLANEGVPLVIHDTLQWCRVAVPGMGDYSLKGVRQWALGKGQRETFRELMGYRGTVTVPVVRTLHVCECGARPCRKRTTAPGHARLTVREPGTAERERDLLYPVPTMTPENPRWRRWLDYSRADAEDGIELVDWLRNRTPGGERPYPWRKHAQEAVARRRGNVPRPAPTQAVGARPGQ